MSNEELSVEAELPEGMDETIAARAAARIEAQLDPEDDVAGNACPAHVPIPEFMHAVAEGNLEKAAEILRSANPIPGLCGRVCPPDQCELACQVSQRTLPMRIGHLVRFVSDWEREHPDTETHKLWRPHRVAVIGSGPAGMVCAGTLARQGYPVTIFEGLEKPGGVLRYGVQDSHFPESILDWEIRVLTRLGVEIRCNTKVGEKIQMDELLGDMGFDAVYVATGAGLTHFLGIPGESLDGVHTAHEFLTRVNMGEAFDFGGADASFRLGDRVVVVGADASVIAALCGASEGDSTERHIIEAGGEEEIPFSAEERQRAVADGFRFHCYVRPIEVLGGGNGEVTGLKCVKLKPADADAEAEAIQGSEFVLRADNVVIAGGDPLNPLELPSADAPPSGRKSGVIVEEKKCMTTPGQVYTGADAGRGAAAVIVASNAGRQGAEAIHKQLCDEDWSEIQTEDEWGEFVDWCSSLENAAHE